MSAYFIIFAVSNNRLFVLVVRKALGVPNNAGQLIFPGGRRERGENTAAAAARELGEETGVAFRDRELRSPGRDPIRSMSVRVHDWRNYGAVFVQVSFEELSTLHIAVSRVLAARQADGELTGAELMTARQARDEMIREHDARDPQQSTDWFTAAIDYLLAELQRQYPGIE